METNELNHYAYKLDCHNCHTTTIITIPKGELVEAKDRICRRCGCVAIHKKDLGYS